MLKLQINFNTSREDRNQTDQLKLSITHPVMDLEQLVVFKNEINLKGT
jgi:hypothetical protein